MQVHIQADGMKLKSVVILIVFISVSNCFILSNYVEECKADVLPKFYVDDNYNSSTPGWQVDHFDKIQDAINVSVAGDRIIVYAGTYYENLTINHKIDLFGEDRNIVFINGGNLSSTITINAEHVNISHFTIKSSGNSTYDAVINVNFSYTIITDNIITNGKHGISINNCNYSTIYDNTIQSNSGDGIRLNNSNYNDITYNTIKSNLDGLFSYNSSNNAVENNSAIQNTNNGMFLNETSDYNSIWLNTISNNTKNGVFLNDHCDHNILSNNSIYSNNNSGIRSENSSYNNIANSTVNSNKNYGIMAVGSGNTIQNNTINSNSEHNVFLFADDNNIIKNNTMNNSTKDGISLSNSTADSIYNNEVSGNLQYGIQLDYFTISNTIYNNYIHDNAQNAMDKSLSNNMWNITKTSGTNIVGGPNISGNYWDDFDETSEGAIDSDGDGIADSSHTIYASNKDYGPILDVTPPSVGTPQVSPISQKIGGYTYISITATDNIKIKAVYLQVIDPNGAISNFSILQNKTGNIYYFNKQFSPIGKYTFQIAAKDPRNWANSTNGTFNIIEGIPPTVTDNTSKEGSPSKMFIFNATVTDDTDAASELTVKVRWNQENNEFSGNYSMVNVYGNVFEMGAMLSNSTKNLTYSFYASDHWGNAITTAEKTVSVIDNESPNISIEKYGPSSDDMPNKYTFGAKITDDTEVSDVFIEYWYAGSGNITAKMDKVNNSYYQKDIELDQPVDRLYCIINATDISGNHNDTRSPFANASGPYAGVIAIQTTFDATKSFDLDGNITDYSWDFGDGTNGSGVTTKHVYSAVGNYTVTLTLTDDDGNKGNCTTYASIIQAIVVMPSNETINKTEKEYDVNLPEMFYSYDTNGDYVVDKFIDPNIVLKAVRDGSINISGNICFLLSINDSYFMWDTTADKIVKVTHTQITLDDSNTLEDEVNEQATATIKVEKAYWMFIEMNDKYPNSPITVKAGNRTISSDMITRNNNKIYILDDAETNYTITFQNIYPTLGEPTIIPSDGGIINEDQKTITIAYDVPVEIISASFNDVEVTSELTTSDNMEFTYTPPGYWADGTYDFSIEAKALKGHSQKTSTASYFYTPYASPPLPPEKSFIEKNLIWIMLSGIVGAAFVLLFISKRKKISLESFVYVKNKKGIPFLKPIVFGPLKIDVNDENVKKAEFYVNGQLKDTITEPPFIWNWDEKAFMKQKIETVVYDENGNKNSSGEMTFFVFNSPRNPK